MNMQQHRHSAEQQHMQHYMDNSGTNHHSMNVLGQSSNNNNTMSSSAASHYVFGGGSSQATSTLQPLPNTSSLLSGVNGNQHVVGNNQHTNSGQNSTTSIQMQLQQLQQYQQRYVNNNNTNQQQQLPSLATYPSQQNPEDDQLIDWINEHPSRILQQPELPPFESDFGFDGWFQSEENLNNVLSQQLTNGYFQNSMMGNMNNQGGQEMDNYQSRLGSNYNLNSMTGNMMQNGQPNFVLDDPNFNAWGESGELDLDEGVLNKHQGNPLFGGTQLFTNHTISTTENKGVTSITALANSLNFSDSPQMKKTRKAAKKASNIPDNYQQNNYDAAYDQNLLDMDTESFKNYVIILYGEKGKKRNKTQVPFDEEDFSKLLLAKDRITELYQQCQQDTMNLVSSVMSQYTSSLEMDDLSKEMSELYNKVNAKLDYKNAENKNHCEQVLKKLIFEWIDMVKAQKTLIISDKTSNDSSNKSSKKSKSTNRRLPNEAKKVLENWFLEHYKHPYPTNEEKQWLSDQTQLNLTQINNWFINKRGRSLKIVKEKLRTEVDGDDEE